MRHKLDTIDRRILELLRNDGRMPNAALAKEVGISPPPCLRRLRALEEAGFIKGYQAVIDDQQLGYNCTVFTGVRLKGNTAEALSSFGARFATWPEVREAHMLAGDVDYLLKIVTTSWESYQEFLAHTLMQAPEVAQVSSAPAVTVNTGNWRDVEEKQKTKNIA